MANWYMTNFETKDKDIVEIIKNGQTIDFNYDNETGAGHCRLGWGLASIDMEKVTEIATDHKSSFRITSSDFLANVRQTWEFKNGIEIASKVEHGIFDMSELMCDEDEDEI